MQMLQVSRSIPFHLTATASLPTPVSPAPPEGAFGLSATLLGLAQHLI